MPKNTSRYVGPRDKAARESKTAATAPRRFGLAGRFAHSIGARLRRPAPGRYAVILGSLLLATTVGLASLGLALYLSKVDKDWASVAAVNGHSIDREQLRGRMAVLLLLAQQRSEFDGAAVTASNLTTDQASALRTTIAATTTLEAAREGLIDDELLRELAARDGVAAPANPDPWTEATSYISADMAHRLRFVRFGLPTSPSGVPGTPPDGWPAAAITTIDATTALVRAQLDTSTPIATIMSELRQAGWQVLGEDVSVSADGLAVDATLQLDPSIAAATLRGKPGDVVGPVADAYGRVSVARVMDAPSAASISSRLPSLADTAKVDSAAVQAWANGQALRRAVTASLISKWRNASINQAHFRELVIGTNPTGGTAGPWVELSALAIDRLQGLGPGFIAGAPAGLDLSADGLAKALKTMNPADRTTLFRALVSAANKTSDSNGAGLSGELGFHTKVDLAPGIGSAAFDPAVHTGDVIGPIQSSTGPRLYLVESRYSGTLDERATAALGQLRLDPSPDLAGYAKRLSPADAALATNAIWRTDIEFAPADPARAALFETPVGALSDPFVLDGKLAVALLTERKSAVPDAAAIDRLTLLGYTAWYESEFAKATITRADNPLPELLPSATPSPTATTPAVMPSIPALDTPNLPKIPGQSATPARSAAKLPGMP